MNKNEILQKSRNENRGKDVADIEIAKSGMRLGWCITACLAMVVGIIDMMVFGVRCFGTLFAVNTGLSVLYIYKYIMLRKKSDLFTGICWGFVAAVDMVIWILYLVDR